MPTELNLSLALQRRLVDGLIDDHPLPWSISHETSDEWLCEVSDARKRVVLRCMDEGEAVELIDAAMQLALDNAKTHRDLDRAAHQEKVRMTPPKSASYLFDKRLPQALAKHPAKARELAMIYRFKVTGSEPGEGGDWVVDCVINPPMCAPRGGVVAPQDPTITITVFAEGLLSIFRERDMAKALMTLYFQGKLSVDGAATTETLVQLAKLEHLFALLSA